MSFSKFLAFVLIFLSSCCNSSVNDVKYTKNVIKKGISSTVAFVRVEPNGNVPLYCAGVWINKDTMLTALHCAKVPREEAQIDALPEQLKPFSDMLIEPVVDPTGSEMLYVTEEETNGIFENPKMVHKSKVIAVDLDHDMAMVRSTDGNMPYHEWLQVSNTIPTIGDKVYIIGHQGGLYFTVMDGMISALRNTFPSNDDDNVKTYGPFIQVYSAIYHGNSGGPVISENGEIVGIASFIAAAPNQGFAIAPTSIKRFIFSAYEKHILN